MPVEIEENQEVKIPEEAEEQDKIRVIQILPFINNLFRTNKEAYKKVNAKNVFAFFFDKVEGKIWQTKFEIWKAEEKYKIIKSIREYILPR